MTTRDYLRCTDFTREDVERLFRVSAVLKAGVKRRQFSTLLAGYSAAMIFQKPSLRTRMTFDLGMVQLGGSAVYLGPAEIALGVRESAHDIAKNLERWVDIIVARVFAQADIEQLAEASRVPVVNALSDDDHPCQAMADYFTLFERGLSGSDIRLAYVGDGNNTCTAIMVLGAILGANIRIATPAQYGPPAAVVDQARAFAAGSGGRLSVGTDPIEAVTGANAVYTDTWASMHTAHETEERRPHFTRFQINTELMGHAEKDAVVMHCLPAHRGEEITDDMVDGARSVIFDEAENRLHIQKAILLECLGKANEV